jgi:hypothetical protein
MKRISPIKKFLYAALLLLTSLIISCGKSVYTGIVEIEIIDRGKLFIESNPKGLTIYIDRMNTGTQTPDTVKNISEGVHTVTLKNEMWSDTSFAVNISDTIIHKLFIDLAANPKSLASVFCSSQPMGARISINDKLLGYTTPSVIPRLMPGIYKIKYSLADFRSDSSEIKLKGGQLSYCVMNLTDTSRVVDYQKSNSEIPSNALTAISIDSKNRKWFLSKDIGLLRLEGNRWSILPIPQELIPSHLTNLFIDNQDRVWLGSVLGLYRNDGAGWIQLRDNLPSEVINAIIQDRHGNCWIGTTKGLVKFNGIKWELYFPGISITCLVLSKEGEIWGGTSRSIIFNFNSSTNLFIQYARKDMDLSEGFLSLYTQAIIFDEDNFALLYFKGDRLEGTVSGIVQFQNSSFQMFTDIKVSYEVDINNFYLDRSNNIWTLTNVGLIKFNKTSRAVPFLSSNANFNSNDCRAFVIDKNEDAWIATMDIGAVKLKKGKY